MRVSELRRRIIRVEIESVLSAVVSQDVVGCTDLSLRPGESRVVYRDRHFVVFGKSFPVFAKKTFVDGKLI